MISQDLLNAYAAHIKADYVRFMTRNGTETPNAHVQGMIDRFAVEFEHNRSYIRVVQNSGQRSAHSFIVLDGHAKWPEGTILKCAGWKSPAQNFARGNVLASRWDKVRWTGA